MNEPPPLPPPKEPTALILGRALLGTLAYLVCGGVTLVGGPNISPSMVFTPLLLLVIASIYLSVAKKFRGFALGVFIGIGFTLLLLGSCFLAGAFS